MLQYDWANYYFNIKFIVAGFHLGIGAAIIQSVRVSGEAVGRHILALIAAGSYALSRKRSLVTSSATGVMSA